jgi:hypothetical protein
MKMVILFLQRNTIYKEVIAAKISVNIALGILKRRRLKKKIIN